jgi:hypothetical protein
VCASPFLLCSLVVAVPPPPTKTQPLFKIFSSHGRIRNLNILPIRAYVHTQHPLLSIHVNFIFSKSFRNVVVLTWFFIFNLMFKKLLFEV